MNNRGKKYIPELDGLRGIAIIMVLLHHGGMSRGGFIGVDIFFVLSGFLITSLLLKEYSEYQRISFKKFYIRRILRLYPLLLLVLSVYLLINFIFQDRSVFIREFIDSIISLCYLTNWSWAFQMHNPDILRHTWSLSIEEQYYLIWPLLMLILLKYVKKKKWIVSIVFTLALFSWLTRVILLYNGASIFRVYNGLDTRADALMVGSLLAIIENLSFMKNKVKAFVSKLSLILCPFSFLVFLFINRYIDYTEPIVYLAVLTIVNLSTAIIILNIIHNPQNFINKILALYPLRQIGVISYGIYLIHYPVMRFMWSHGFHHLLVTVIGSSAALILALASYSFYEKPFLKMKNRFSAYTNEREELTLKAAL